MFAVSSISLRFKKLFVKKRLTKINLFNLDSKSCCQPNTMKNTFLFIALLLQNFGFKAQIAENDSLQGFDLPATVIKAHQMNLTKEELKFYINTMKRDYIIEKFYSPQQNPAAHLPSKYSANYTNNLPCMYEDFEFYPAGALTATVGWIADQNNGYFPVCNPTLIPTFTTNSSAVVIYTTPVTDAICGTIPASPFGGTNIVKINNTGVQVGRIRQTFPVTSSNWLYNYAYMGVLSEALHGCCQDAYLMFRFYDGAGNPISSLSHTVVMGTPSCVATSTVNWSVSTASVGGYGVRYTPNWQTFGKNLSAFIGTIVTVEVIAGGSFGAHPGYMFYDAKCSDAGIIVNDQVISASNNSYTSCATTATLSGFPDFSSYLWQGPPTSTISGSTSSVVTTNVSGNYTLTSTAGTVTSIQTLNLVVSQTTMSIIGNNTLCNGGTSTLQVASNGLTTYSWSTNSTLQTISVSPSVTTTYSVIASNSLSCFYTASETVTVFPIPVMSLLSSTPSICSGQTTNLFSIASGISSYTWNTGTLSSSIAVSPTLTTVYTVSGTTSSGCLSSASKTVIVFPLPHVQITQSSLSLCSGDSVTLTATALPGNSYSWSTGQSFSSIVVSPTITSSYSVVATTTNGCQDSDSEIITVYSLPQIQLIASSAEICVGQVANLVVTGSNIASTLWSNGANSLSISVSPSFNSVYSVTVASTYGCLANQSTSLNVNPLPLVQIIASSSSICIGENATLTATGSSNVNYQWNWGQTTSSITITPSVTTQYVLAVTDSNGCSSNATFQLGVFPCTDTFVGVEENSSNPHKIIIYPNPSNGMFEIKGYEKETGWLVNDLGQIISEFYLTAENNYTLKISNLAKGVYFLTSSKGSEKIIVK